MGDIVPGPRDTMWAAGFMLIAKVTRDGQVSGFQLDPNGEPDIGLPEAMTQGPDGEIWFTSEGSPPSVKRILDDGTVRTHPLGKGVGDSDLSSIATGPDNALWFTESPIDPSEKDAISRLTPDGRYSRWDLPHENSGPTDIVAGPDGAMWFTEQTRYAIGRISMDGDIREFTLKPGVAPFAITSDSDSALWFTAGTLVGRITTSGQLTTWPVDNAKNLGAIEQDPDGSFWITDGEADTVRHFEPPR